jgi:hypothetical protein
MHGSGPSPSGRPWSEFSVRQGLCRLLSATVTGRRALIADVKSRTSERKPEMLDIASPDVVLFHSGVVDWLGTAARIRREVDPDVALEGYRPFDDEREDEVRRRLTDRLGLDAWRDYRDTAARGTRARTRMVRRPLPPEG